MEAVSEIKIPFTVERTEEAPAKGASLFGLLGLRYRAWLTRQSAIPQLQILEARRRVARAATATEEAEAEVEFRREVRSTLRDRSPQLLHQEVQIERLLAERDRVRESRQLGALADCPALPEPAIEWMISSREIEKEAVQAVTQIRRLVPELQEAAWAQWRQELFLRLPTYAAQEVAQRARHLRDLTG